MKTQIIDSSYPFLSIIYASRKIRVFSNTGSGCSLPIQAVCGAIQGRVRGQELFVLGTISGARVRPIVVELCLNIFPWARLVKERAALKLHLELALDGNI